jgi:hypothetical protein
MNDIVTARVKWRHDIEHGVTRCPVCDRAGVIYNIRMNRTMVRGLIWLEAEQARTGALWIDVPAKGPRWLVRSNQLSSLARWGLVERRAKPEDPKNRTRYSGLWRMTTKGEAFRDGLISVPDRVFVYNDETLSFSDKQVKIHECFDTFFDYQEAIKARGNV